MREAFVYALANGQLHPLPSEPGARHTCADTARLYCDAAGAVRVNPEPVLDLSAFRIRACTAADWNREECATMSASFGTSVGDAGAASKITDSRSCAQLPVGGNESPQLGEEKGSVIGETE